MSDLEYKGKYLKYKNKYLTLKNQVDTENNLDNYTQSGGNNYYKGMYVFFLNKYQVNKDKTETGNNIEKNLINNFDEFTNQLGNCAYFLRIGTAKLDLTRVVNDFNTIYPNKSSLGASASSFSFLNGLTMLKIFSPTKVKEDDKKDVKKDIPFEIKYLCYYKKIPLSSIGFVGNDSEVIKSKGFEYDFQVTKTDPKDPKKFINLIQLVKGINEIIVTKPDDGNEISTILIIDKKGNITNDAVITRRYDITYPEDKTLDKSKNTNDESKNTLDKFQNPTITEFTAFE